MKKTLLILLLLTAKFCVAQNLIPNGDFEQYTGCPTWVAQLSSANFWSDANTGTSDYYNQCSMSNANVPNTGFGFQQAHSGAAFAGVVNWYGMAGNYREYLETPFTSASGSALAANQCYQFQMYINLANNSEYLDYDIGVYFSDSLITGGNYYNLSFVPQIVNTSATTPDTSTWKLVTGTYTAHGGETYLIIGNFYPDSVSSAPIVNPTGYYASYIFVDDVSLVPCEVTGIVENSNSPFSIYPNPANETFFIETRNKSQESRVEICNVIGEVVRDLKMENGQLTVDVREFPAGMYFVSLITDGKREVRKLVKE